MLNFNQLRTDIKEVSEQLKNLRIELRRPHRLITWQEYMTLSELRERATILCSIRANWRGKIHCSKYDKQEQVGLIAPHVQQYLLKA